MNKVMPKSVLSETKDHLLLLLFSILPSLVNYKYRSDMLRIIKSDMLR